MEWPIVQKWHWSKRNTLGRNALAQREFSSKYKSQTFKAINDNETIENCLRTFDSHIRLTYLKPSKDRKFSLRWRWHAATTFNILRKMYCCCEENVCSQNMETFFIFTMSLCHSSRASKSWLMQSHTILLEWKHCVCVWSTLRHCT